MPQLIGGAGAEGATSQLNCRPVSTVSGSSFGQLRVVQSIKVSVGSVTQAAGGCHHHGGKYSLPLSGLHGSHHHKGL